MKSEDVSMFKLIQVKLGTKTFRYFSCPHATIKLYFSQLKAYEIRNLIDFLKFARLVCCV